MTRSVKRRFRGERFMSYGNAFGRLRVAHLPILTGQTVQIERLFAEVFGAIITRTEDRDTTVSTPAAYD
jgi:hypothetical protein